MGTGSNRLPPRIHTYTSCMCISTADAHDKARYHNSAGTPHTHGTRHDLEPRQHRVLARRGAAGTPATAGGGAQAGRPLWRTGWRLLAKPHSLTYGPKVSQRFTQLMRNTCPQTCVEHSSVLVMAGKWTQRPAQMPVRKEWEASRRQRRERGDALSAWMCLMHWAE